MGTGRDNGNLLGLTSTYQTTDGASHAVADVWFTADKAAANTPASADAQNVDLNLRASNLAQLISGFGSTSVVDAFTPPPANEPPITASCGLLASPSVGAMVDAMKLFDSNGNPPVTTSPSAASVIKPPGLTALPNVARDGTLTGGG